MAQRRGASPKVGEHPPTRGEDYDVGSRANGDTAQGPRWTSGRECWVFRAETLGDLCGYHPQLIGSALTPGETIRHLLYAPFFDAREGPFHVGAAPGSHAVALTTRRLLVSHDPHSSRGARSVQAIDLRTVDSIEIGGALTLAWFVVRFSGPAGPAACPVVFSAHGLDHFRLVVRAYLDEDPSVPVPASPPLDWPSVFQGTPAFLSSELEPLTRGTDPPLAVLRTLDRWAGAGRRRGAVCLSAAGLLTATARGLLWAASEARTRPDGLSFGVNITVVRSDRVASASVSSRAVQGTLLPVLHVHAGDGPAGTKVEVPFDEPDLASAESIVRLASSWREHP